MRERGEKMMKGRGRKVDRKKGGRSGGEGEREEIHRGRFGGEERERCRVFEECNGWSGLNSQ